MKEETEKLVWEPDEANLVFNSVGSLSLSLSDLNKQLSKKEVYSKPVNTQDGSKAKCTVTAKVVLKIQTVEGIWIHNHTTVTVQLV